MEEVHGTRMRFTEETEGVDSRDKVKHNERSAQLFYRG